MHVLIIEDDLLMALDVEACVESIGVRSTDLASTEEHAVKLAVARRPDLIASDVRLAQGTGPDAVRRIQSHYGPIPVIYITGNPESARQADPEAPVLVKPLDWSELTDMMSSLIATHDYAVAD